jgi:hypothetical protein
MTTESLHASMQARSHAQGWEREERRAKRHGPGRNPKDAHYRRGVLPTLHSPSGLAVEKKAADSRGAVLTPLAMAAVGRARENMIAN